VAGPAIDIIQFDYAGTGCPQGTASVFVNGNTAELNMLFDQYVAMTSPGQRSDDKNCSLAVQLRIPPGYKIAPNGFEYSGYAYIPAQGEGLLNAAYYVTGGAGVYIYSTSFPAGRHGNWLNVDVLDDAGWTPCGGEIVGYAGIDTAVRKASASSSDEGVLILDSIVYWFDWAYC
jgi:hypothetical protein